MINRNRISATVSPSRITYEPGSAPPDFDVIVINESEQFAAFQLEVIAPGYSTDPNRKWYSTEPKISTKKPPGDRTQFRVLIIDTPTPGFVGRVELIVRVLALEFRDEARQPLSLEVQPGASYLAVDLPVKRLQVYPRNTIEIPVRLYNPRRQAADVAVNLLNLNPNWLPNGGYQQLQILAGQQAVARFLCCPPTPLEAPCEDYPFVVEATPLDGSPVRTEGILEVLPAGFVEFKAHPKLQQIPPRKRWWSLNWRSDPVAYTLEFENTSNLWQQVGIVMQGKDQKRCSLNLIPEDIILDPAEKSYLDLTVRKKRPWLGLSKRLLLEAEAELQETHNPNAQVLPNPRSQLLELWVLPIIPPWLQALLALLLLLLLLFWPQPPRHLEPVTAIQISGDAGTVLSGSRDQTIRRWRVNEDHLESAGLLADTGKAVRVIRYQPVDNNVVAAGLENGEIQLWDVLSREKLRTLFFNKDDRVFSLAFARDSRHLYSGHGSGRVLEWNLESSQKTPNRRITLPFTVYAVEISEKTDRRILAIAGRYNQLVLWNLDSNLVYKVNYYHQDVDVPSADQGVPKTFQPAVGQHNYIESLAISDNGNVLATADNQGYITLWNLAETSCHPDRTCAIPILQQWRDGHQGKPVRSVALTSNSCYLASVGDDGRIMLWPLTEKGKRVPLLPLRTSQSSSRDTQNRSQQTNTQPLEVAHLSVKLNSVDITINQGNILIASDDYNNQIRLYRLEGKGFNPSCRPGFLGN